MSHILIIPGWRDSPPGHWQSLWAEQLPGAVRVQSLTGELPLFTLSNLPEETV